MDRLTASEPPRKRQRKAKSCEQCRNRKIRCDQIAPCGPCQRSRDHLTCTYRDAIVDHRETQPVLEEQLNGHLSTIAVSDHSYPYQARRLELAAEGELGQPRSPTRYITPSASQAHNSDTDGAARIPSHRSETQTLSENAEMSSQNEKIRGLDERIRRLEEQVRSELLREPLRGALNATDRSSFIVDPIKPRLRLTQEKVKIFPQSHWVHTAEKSFNLGSFNSEVVPNLGLTKAEWKKACKELRDLRHLVKTHQQLSSNPLADLSNLRATLPSRVVCDALVANYVRTFERIYRVLNIPEFLKECDQFWKSPQSLAKSFVVKLVLVLAIGTTFAQTSQVNNETADELRRKAQQWIYAAQSWLTGPTEKSTQNLRGLQIFCLLVVARQTTGLGSSPSVSTASLLSMAMQMGLHLNTRNLQTPSRSQGEIMARLWSTVVELYLASCFESGTPLPTTFEEFDARYPSDMNDSELIGEAACEASNTLGDRITDTSIHLLLCKSRNLRIQVLRVVNGVGSQTPYEDVVALGNKVRNACTDASTFFSTHFSYLGSDEMFHRKYLDMYLRRYILLLHRPFMLASQNDPRFYLSRKMCLESCMITASYADELRLPSKALDEFSSLLIQGSGHLRGGLSLDVIMTLVYELNAQHQEDGSTQRQNVYNPVRELANAAREPIVRRLEHIREQLSQIIALGNPSLKSFVLISAALAQIKALEVGGDVKAEFYAAVKEAMQRCTKSLQAYLARQPDRAANTVKARASVFEEYDSNLDDLDFENLLDPMVLFNTSALG